MKPEKTNTSDERVNADDIVKRLRVAAGCTPFGLPVHRLYADAADEIERLRDENAILRETIDGLQDAMDGRRKENAMLREALKDCADGIESNLRARYGIGESGYIDLEIQRRFVRDMQPAFDARAALEKTK